MAEAIDSFHQIITIAHELGAVTTEANLFVNLGATYEKMWHITDAISSFEQAITIMETHNLTHDAGGMTLEQYQEELARIVRKYNGNRFLKVLKLIGKLLHQDNNGR